LVATIWYERALPTAPLPVVGLVITGGSGSTVKPKVSFAPRYDAVKVTGVGAATLPGVATNVVDVEPWGMVTVEGKLRSAGAALRAMVAPELSAGAVNATVQVVPAGVVIVIGVHVKPFRPPWTIVTTPEVVETGSDTAVGPAAVSLVSWTVDEASVVELDKLSATVAAMPLGIAVESKPQRMHVWDPATLLHVIDLLAAVASGPAATVAEEKSTVE
jgi:hypothetical protein